jgi:iron complex outermembrane receptor protein
MKKITLLFLLLNVSFLLHKRNIWCRKDASSGTPGVNIVEKGTQNGVSTNMDGAYKIKVKQGATIVLVTLVFSNGKATTASIM